MFVSEETGSTESSGSSLTRAEANATRSGGASQSHSYVHTHNPSFPVSDHYLDDPISSTRKDPVI